MKIMKNYILIIFNADKIKLIIVQDIVSETKLSGFIVCEKNYVIKSVSNNLQPKLFPLDRPLLLCIKGQLVSILSKNKI